MRTEISTKEAIAFEMKVGYSLTEAVSAIESKGLRRYKFATREIMSRVVNKASDGLVPSNMANNSTLDPWYCHGKVEITKAIDESARFGGFIKSLADTGLLEVAIYRTHKKGVLFSLRDDGWNAGAADQQSWEQMLGLAKRFNYNPGLCAKVMRKAFARVSCAVRSYMGWTVTPRWALTAQRQAVINHCVWGGRRTWQTPSWQYTFGSLRASAIIPAAIEAVMKIAFSHLPIPRDSEARAEILNYESLNFAGNWLKLKHIRSDVVTGVPRFWGIWNTDEWNTWAWNTRAAQS